MLITVFGFLEYFLHKRTIKKIPIRIHVNGIRGKSTTVRLIAACLREAGYSVLAKTTGTVPRIILENGTEKEIKRKFSANIIEQKYFVRRAAKKGVDAIVVECMAVNPETQWVSEHQLIKSTIGVITNVRADHQDVYGFKLQDIADALKSTIPENGLLVTAEKKYFSYFKRYANLLNTKSILADFNKLSGIYYEETPHLFFKDNIAIALEVSRLLKIDTDTALQGILKATPDPGALTIYKLVKNKKILWFINSFAVNDKESLLLVWEKVNQLFSGKKTIHAKKLAIVNHREDRITRTIQFDQILANNLFFSKIILIGPTSPLSQKKLIDFGYPSENIYRVKKERNPAQIIETIFQFIEEYGIVYGLCNTKGAGMQIIEYFQENGEEICYTRQLELE